MGIQFNRYVTNMLAKQDYKAYKFLKGLPEKVFDDFQLKLINYIDNTKSTIGQLPSVMVFAEDWQPFYNISFQNVSETELRQKLKQELTRNYAITKSNKLSLGDNIDIEDVYDLTKTVAKIDRDQLEPVEADMIVSAYSGIGDNPIQVGVPALDNDVIFVTGDIFYINGISGAGKSYISQYIVAKNLLEGQTILVAPCEQTKNVYNARLTSILYGFSHKDAIVKIANNKQLKDKYDTISYWTFKYLKEKCKGRLVYTEDNMPSLVDFSEDYKNVRPAFGVIDSVYDLAQFHPSFDTGGQYVAERHISNGIKLFCKNGFETADGEWNNPRIIANNQLSPAAETASIVGANDVRGSKQFTIDADISLALKQDAGITNGYELQSIKLRNSGKGIYKFTIDWDTMEFVFYDSFGKYKNGLYDLCGHSRDNINKFAYDTGKVVLSL